jgi:hypothetical protein
MNRLKEIKLIKMILANGNQEIMKVYLYLRLYQLLKKYAKVVGREEFLLVNLKGVEFSDEDIEHLLMDIVPGYDIMEPENKVIIKRVILD